MVDTRGQRVTRAIERMRSCLRSGRRLGCGLLLGLVFALPGPASAGIYKWVDENGKVHYSDKPPAAGAEEMDVKVEPSGSPAGVSDAERREKLKRLLDAFDKERAEKKALAEEASEEKRVKAEECARMRDELTELKEAGYLYDYDEAGNKVIFTQEERAKATAEYEEAYAKHC